MKNFNKDWNDGIAIAGLVEATAPGLFPEWEDLLPENKLENAKEAMKRAEDWLGVPQVRGKTTSTLYGFLEHLHFLHFFKTL